MIISIKDSTFNIEKKFNEVRLKINSYILDKNSKQPPQELFLVLDKEFYKVKQKYEEQNDNINLLFATHNYLWTKTFQYLDKEPTRSFLLIVESLSKLFERHILKNYDKIKFENMLKSYEVALIKISEKKEKLDFDKIEKEFVKFLETYFLNNKITVSSEHLTNVLNIMASLVIVEGYEQRINIFKINLSNIQESEKIVNNIKSILNILENTYSIKKTYLPSLCYEAIYKIRKKQLHCLVRIQFFERSNEKRNKIQKIINEIAPEMIKYTKKSLDYYKNYCKSLSEEKKREQNIKLALTLKELDFLSARYYEEAYSKKDIIRAWKVIDEIKHFLVLKVFKENIPLSENLLTYFGEEWSLLHIFAKISLLKEEVKKRYTSVGEKWEQDIFSSIIDSLQNMQKMFKYNLTDNKDYILKIITSQFSGGFSEYFIHDLCIDYFENGLLDDKTPMKFKELFECIKLSRKEDIKKNDFIEKGKPDIDIHIKKKCAIFLKNSSIKSEEIQQIWKEIQLCKRYNIKKIFYGINFIKNIQEIEYIRNSFEKIKNHFQDIHIQIFDIKDLVAVFLSELKRGGKTKLNFSSLDLYKVLDY